MSGKHAHRKSDRMNFGATQTIRVGAGTLKAFMPFRWTEQGKAMRDEALRANGREPYTSQSRLCACGKPALRVWKNIGYCKAHAPERV